MSDVELWQKLWGWTLEEATKRSELLKNTKVVWYFDENRNVSWKRVDRNSPC